MLSGCPDCGGNKFQFQPDGTDADGTSEPDAEPPEPPEPAADGVSRAVGSAATAVRDMVSSGPDSPSSQPDAAQPEQATDAGDAAVDADATASSAGETASGPDSAASADPGASAGTGNAAQADSPAENAAQASARTEVVPKEELPTAGADEHPTPVLDDDSETAKTAEGDRPDLADLRAELNDQFESIRVLEPGQYELNLMELYDREEYIIALQEDGKYTIQVPERWKDT
jgi:predicted  nucleic acid-binding Zn-ribbon protein